jgi:predicted Zn-dependent protease
MAQQGRSAELEGYDWQFNVIDSQEVNAWAMPGGKVVVYTGILPYTQDEDGLAVVMSHEIAHVIAKHGAEQMSQQLLLNAGGAVVEKTTNSAIFQQVYGIGATYGVQLPYSRTHEYEADHLGLIFMAMAGYDPNQAPIFWKRMSQSGGSSTPEFMSTHPSDENRIARLNALMPQVGQYKAD